MSTARSASSSFVSLPGDLAEQDDDAGSEREDDDLDEKSCGKGYKITAKTADFLHEAFTSCAPNSVQRQWRECFGHPSSDFTMAPFMDKLVKGRLLAGTKSRGRQLSKGQALFLDATGPLVHVLEEAVRGTLTMESSVAACQQALRFLGNASAHINREHRRNATLDMNKGLADMADDDAIFRSAPPSLFGDGFSKKAKERSDELKCLSQASGSSSKPERQNSFFRQSRPQNGNNAPRGSYSGRSRRGGGFKPYHLSNPFRQQKSSSNSKDTKQ